MPETVKALIQTGTAMLAFNNDKPIRADAPAMARARTIAADQLRCQPLGLAPSFGFGDRLGLATPGHVAALNRLRSSGILPIFCQQSIREMTRTARSPQQVMDDASFGVLLAGYTGKQGADADHLKTPEDVDRTAAAGFVFFTIDPSGEVDGKADDYAPAELETKFKALAGQVDWLGQYEGKSVKLKSGTTITLDRGTCLKCAVKYGRAINLVADMSKHIAATAQKLNQGYEIELSVDETPQPTTPAEHYIFADQVLKRGSKLVSLAPRFVGDFEKGVDYKGSIQAFEKSLADHAAIAELLGPYKLSLHSGSDKLSIYTAFAKATKGRFHVKTAGTSYLEALRAVARLDPSLFRKLIDFSRSRYDTDRATYHVSATLESAPPQDQIKDPRALERQYLELWPDVPKGKGFTEPARQILHCTFGSVLMDKESRAQVVRLLENNRSTYDEILAEHFEKHLQALAAGM